MTSDMLELLNKLSITTTVGRLIASRTTNAGGWIEKQSAVIARSGSRATVRYGVTVHPLRRHETDRFLFIDSNGRIVVTGSEAELNPIVCHKAEDKPFAQRRLADTGVIATVVADLPLQALPGFRPTGKRGFALPPTELVAPTPLADLANGEGGWFPADKSTVTRSGNFLVLDLSIVLSPVQTSPTDRYMFLRDGWFYTPGTLPELQPDNTRPPTYSDAIGAILVATPAGEWRNYPGRRQFLADGTAFVASCQLGIAAISAGAAHQGLLRGQMPVSDLRQAAAGFTRQDAFNESGYTGEPGPDQTGSVEQL